MAVNDAVYTGNRSASILHTASTTAEGYSALSLSSIVVSIREDDIQNTGGGAVGGGVGGGAVAPIALLVGVPSTPVSSPRLCRNQSSLLFPTCRHLL
jgi:hypothetical protein